MPSSPHQPKGSRRRPRNRFSHRLDRFVHAWKDRRARFVRDFKQSLRRVRRWPRTLLGFAGEFFRSVLSFPKYLAAAAVDLYRGLKFGLRGFLRFLRFLPSDLAEGNRNLIKKTGQTLRNVQEGTVDSIKYMPLTLRERRKALLVALARKTTKIALVVLVGMGGLTALGYYVALPEYRAWKGRVFLNNALTLMADEDYRGAFLTLRQALVKDFGSLPINRAMAELGDRTGDPGNALFYWERVATVLDPGEWENYVGWAQSALEFGFLAEAEKALGHLNEEDMSRPEVVWVRHRFHQLQGAGEEERRILENLLAANPEDQEARAHLLLLDLRQGPENPLFWANRDRLQALVRSHSEVALIAYRGLLTIDLRNRFWPESLRTARALAEFNGQLTTEDRFNILEAYYRSNSERRFRGLLDSLEEEALAGEGDVQLRKRILQFKFRHQLLEDAYAWYVEMPESQTRSTDYQLEFSDILIQKERWEELEKFLRGKNWRDRDFIRNAFLALSYERRDNPGEFLAEWNVALNKAQREVGASRILASLSQNWGWDEQRFAFLQQLARRFPNEGWISGQLIEIFVAREATGQLRQFLGEQVLRMEPGELRQNLETIATRIDLLLGQEVDALKEQTEALLAANPNEPSLLINLALAQLLQENFEEAWETLEIAREQPSRVDYAVRFYQGLVLAARGDIALAREMLERFEGLQLLPEERQLLERFTGLLPVDS